MPTPWIRAVQETGQLTVCPGDELKKAPAWGEALFTRILDEFNRLAGTNTLGVRLVRINTKPSPSGKGANVLFEASHGDCKFFNHKGGEEHASINVGPGSLKGITAPITVPAANKLGWAFIFVPINPAVSTRLVGTNVRMEIGLHELLHACGLTSDDPGHEPPGSRVDGDIFDGHSIVFEGDDHVFAGGRSQPNAAGQFFIKARTVGLVQSIWLLGQF